MIDMQFELPLALAPTPVPTGTLRYIQLGSEIVGYRFRRARRRSIGLAIRPSPKSKRLSGKRRAGC